MKKAVQDHNQNYSSLFWLIGGSLALVVLTLGLLPFFNNRPTESDQTPVGVIAQYPQQFTGNIVEVDGTITNRIGYRGLTIKGEGLLEDEVLVISANPLEAVGGSGDSEQLFNQEKPVRVEGQVQIFNLSQIEDQIGFDLPDDEFKEWEGKPVIVTNSVHNTQ